MTPEVYPICCVYQRDSTIALLKRSENTFPRSAVCLFVLMASVFKRAVQSTRYEPAAVPLIYDEILKPC